MLTSLVPYNQANLCGITDFNAIIILFYLELINSLIHTLIHWRRFNQSINQSIKQCIY